MAPRQLTEGRKGGRLLTKGWSDWERALVPLDDDLEYRCDRDEVGLICSSIRNAFPDCCGIYEWKAVGTFEGQPEHVVYAGSTGRLRHRILEYCTDGSHKEELIYQALRRGYELWVRIKIVKRSRHAEDREDDLLDEYDYAWNKTRNGKIRDILPRKKSH